MHDHLTAVPGGCRKSLPRYLNVQLRMDLFIKWVVVNIFLPITDIAPAKAPLNRFSIRAAQRRPSFGWRKNQNTFQRHLVQPGEYVVRFYNLHLTLNRCSTESFAKFSRIEKDFEKEGPENPLNELYRKTEETELVQAEKRVWARQAELLRNCL